MEKVSVYIDGFNLYFGLRSKYPKSKWLDVYKLSENLLKENQKLIDVKYFTAMVSNNPEKEERQRKYISAIKTTETKIIYGHYKSKSINCFRCKHTWIDNEEKMTDVNISVEMIIDAIENKIDKAILISGDSDLIPPVNTLITKFNKKVIVAFPPNRHNVSVKNNATTSMILGKNTIKKSQFDEKLLLENKYEIQKPIEWY